MIHLTRNQENEIRAHGAEEFPLECCGALLGAVESGEKIVREVRRLQNAHEDEKQRRFLIAPETIRDLMTEENNGGMQVLGFYHSHPNHPAQPSATDRLRAWEWWSYLIISVQNAIPAELRAWTLNDMDSDFVEEEIAIS